MTKTETLKPGDIVYAKAPGGKRRLRVRVLHVSSHLDDGFILGRRIKLNDDGSTSTYGNDNLYYVPDGWND